MGHGEGANPTHAGKGRKLIAVQAGKRWRQRMGGKYRTKIELTGKEKNMAVGKQAA